MKQAVTLALTLTLAAGLLAGCSGESAGGGVQPTGAAQTSPVDATPTAAAAAGAAPMQGSANKKKEKVTANF